MNKNEMVSVIIPLYNAEKYIAETIESVLQQTYQNFEVIVIDDCGTDHSVEIVKRYKDERIKIFHNERNMGIAYSRNRGLKESSGEYIALLDNDDVAINTRLEKQVAFLQEHPEIDVVSGNAQWIDENGKVVRDTIDVIEDPLYIKMILMFRNIYNNSEMTFRKSLVETYHIEYSDGCLGMEDFWFWVQCSNVAKFGCIPDLVLKKRVMASNETARMKQKHAEERRQKYWEIQKQALKMNGFSLNQDDEQMLLRMFSESGCDTCSSSEELQAYYHFMRKLIMQARAAKKEYCLQLESWFRGLLIWGLQNMKDSYIWD